MANFKCLLLHVKRPFKFMNLLADSARKSISATFIDVASEVSAARDDSDTTGISNGYVCGKDHMGLWLFSCSMYSARCDA